MTTSFSLAEPRTLAEASATLAELGPDARCYAGGVRLLIDMREGRESPRVLVNLKGIPELTSVGREGEWVRLGACVTHAAVAAACATVEGLEVLPAMATAIGNVRVRNMGTIGGNVSVADPHSDPATALLLVDAEAEVFGPGGLRTMPLSQFQTGPFTLALGPGEFLAGLRLRPLPHGSGSAYERVQRLLPPTLTVAAAAQVAAGALRGVRLSIGSVSPAALRLTALEEALEGLSPADAAAAITERAQEIEQAVAPQSDLWGSADYKTHISTVLLRRALAAAAARAQEAKVA